MATSHLRLQIFQLMQENCMQHKEIRKTYGLVPDEVDVRDVTLENKIPTLIKSSKGIESIKSLVYG